MPQLPALWAKYGIFVMVAAVVALVFTVTYCAGRNAGKSGEVAAQQGRTIEAQAKESTAAEKAADARASDDVRMVEQQQELSDATRDATSGDDRRRRRGCVILRQQGGDAAKRAGCS